MNFWKIIKVISATIGKFQEAAADGVISLEDAFAILKSALDELGIRLQYAISAQDALATMRRIGMIKT